jgi:hypothetical protein
MSTIWIIDAGTTAPASSFVGGGVSPQLGDLTTQAPRPMAVND